MTEKRCGVCRREGCGWQTIGVDENAATALRKQGVNLEDKSSVAAAIDEKKILLQENYVKLKAQHPLEMSTEKIENTELEALIKEGHSLMGQLLVLGVPEKDVEEMLRNWRKDFPNWGAE